MARPTYGLTWWGRQWLQALTHIDYDNRLPRGRTYANKGAVKHLVVNGGEIHAQVQGSRPRPYAISLSVPPLAQADAARLLDGVADNPALIARLLNRELDPAVLELAHSLGIAVFPTRWQDLDMHCSCPDWAVPCKHLAAVIYILSRDIDGDPFRVFALRGVDLVGALKARGIHIDAQAAVTLPSVADLLLLQDPPDAHSRLVDEADTIDPLAPLDFSALPDLTDSLLRVLPAQPAFSAPGDFREEMQRAMRQVAKTAQRALNAMPDADAASASPLRPPDRPRLELDVSYIPTLKGLDAVSGWDGLLQALGSLNPERLPDLQAEVAALFELRLFALHLLARGAVIPEVFTRSDGSTCLRWVPAQLDPLVRQLLQQIATRLPEGLLAFRQGRRKLTLTPLTQAITLCSLMLDLYVKAWVEPPQSMDAIQSLFFATGRAHLDGPGESAIPGSIQSWLSRLHLAQRRHAPLLVLQEASRKAADLTLSVAIESVSAVMQEPVPLATVLQHPDWTQERYAVLQTVAMLAEFFPPLNTYVRSGAKTPLELAASDLPSFLFDTLPIIRLLGMRALLPKALDQVLRPRLSMRVSGKTQAGNSFFGMDDLFKFDWTVAVGEHQLTHHEFDRLVGSAAGMIRFKGQYVVLDPDAMERLRAQLAKPPRPTGAELLRAALAGEYAGATLGLDAEAQGIIRTLLDAGDVALPASIHATLRPYQERGYAWLYRNARAGLGSVLADDMGLGKTLQVITTLQRLKDEGALEAAKVLVVMPTSLLTNWQKEISRFAPELTVAVFHGAKRELKADRPDVLLTTYGVVRAETATLKAMAWHLLVVDEAQNIKNPAAAQTKAVKAIAARTFIAMSGTPVENRLSEYWSIMDFACRGYLGTLAHFTKEYGVPIQTHRDQLVLGRFKRVTAPFLLRRLKSDSRIIQDLPAKIEQDQYCALSKTQAALYASVVKEGLRVIAGESDTFKRQGLVLQMILALKQICNHPAQYLKQGSTDSSLSGKAERFLELVDAIHASHEKVLVFTQFREMGAILRQWLKDLHGREPLYLHGGVARARRDTLVERFQNDCTERVFLLSLKAGGTGLNLTAASNVIHFDLWWNPAVETQATDRAYRIGQQRNVQVHRLITRATFEERINAMIQSKRELADLTVGTGERWIGQLGNAELKELFTLG
uniref:Helicase, SNF2 family protein n=1 Tax=mine drainage metagenome TaxID=410659 RepID=E6PN57_9ZZZZ